MPATGISNNSAQLNSLILAGGNDVSNAWFEWGTTTNLGIKTVTMFVGALPAIRHAYTLTSLAPGTTIYFRAVAENSYSRNVGPIMSFVAVGRTQSVNTVIIQSSTPTPTIPAPETNILEEKPTPPATSYLGANVVGAGFLPASLLGWFFLFILILIALLLVKYIWDQPQNNRRANSNVLDK